MLRLATFKVAAVLVILAFPFEPAICLIIGKIARPKGGFHDWADAYPLFSIASKNIERRKK
jgi:hypothetical protein